MRLSAVLHRLHLPSPASFFSVLSSKSPKLEPGTLEAIARPRDSSPTSLFSIAGAWKQSRDRRFPSPASTSAGSNREAGRYVRVCSDFDSSPPSLFSPAPASSKVMLGTTGPELLVVNKSDQPIPLEADSFVVITPNQETEATSNLLPINFSGLAKVLEVKGEDVVCLIKNSAVLVVLW
ncbi:hypothetical protein LXL04_037530 [Taraxacum kok-saghyz]